MSEIESNINEGIQKEFDKQNQDAKKFEKEINQDIKQSTSW
jgi:hypothetical protein